MKRSELVAAIADLSHRLGLGRTRPRRAPLPGLLVLARGLAAPAPCAAA